MKLNYKALLDFIFPPTEDEERIAHTTTTQFMTKCAPEMVSKNTYVLASFKDPEVRAAIHLLKFHHHPHAVSLLSALLHLYLQSLPHPPYVIVPMPLSSTREKERGFNQVAVLAKASITNLPQFSVEMHVLQKTKHTQPQTSLARQARLKNVAGAFTLTHNAKEKLQGAHVILLDDVLTTGATLREAHKTIGIAQPLSLSCIALAH